MRFVRCINYLIPPIFYVIYKKIRGSYKTKDQNSKVDINLTGPYSSWEEAIKFSTGYDDDIILEKTKNALLKVKTGEAVYERDSVIFDEIQYSWPLLAALMWVAAHSEGRLNVLDFGGSLGSTYFQNKKFLDTLSIVRWNIVEQSKHVEIGKRIFQDDILKFYHSIEDCVRETNPNVIILSGILQYLERPDIIIKHLLSLGTIVIIDRTPFLDISHDELYAQKIPKEIFEGSYPMWIFSIKKFKEFIKTENIIAEFDGFETGLFGIEWKGFIVKGKND